MSAPWCEIVQAAGMECYRCHKRDGCEHSDEAKERKILAHPAVVAALAEGEDARRAHAKQIMRWQNALANGELVDRAALALERQRGREEGFAAGRKVRIRRVPARGITITDDMTSCGGEE